MVAPDYITLEKQLYIDDDFDSYIERLLTDQTDESGQTGMDGIYDQEQHSMRISDILNGIEDMKKQM